MGEDCCGRGAGGVGVVDGSSGGGSGGEVGCNKWLRVNLGKSGVRVRSGGKRGDGLVEGCVF